MYLIGNDTRWLNATPGGWDQDPDNNRASRVANAMLVVNDCAECNIKQITDYIRFTGNFNGILDNIILVGEDHRSLISNMKRANLLSAYRSINILPCTFISKYADIAQLLLYMIILVTWMYIELMVIYCKCNHVFSKIKLFPKNIICYILAVHTL